MNNAKYIFIGSIIVSCILAASMKQLRVESKQREEELMDWTKQVVFG